jgi:hypothetical protein
MNHCFARKKVVTKSSLRNGIFVADVMRDGSLAAG